MNTTTRLMLALAVSLALVACSKKVKESPDSGTGTSGNTGADTTPISTNGRFTPADLETHACLRQRVVYFDFDQDTLKPDFQAIITCHAKYLQDRPESRMTLEGNADERGTREYNLGLGERRGNAVSSALQGSGGSAGQINVVSYGEERPTCLDSGEDCWAKNRRVEIVYTTK
ncbi:peptidoglycan-associated lipoprotein Pal [Arenimonas sp.]|uniref:peptidoglycan-associated lipoprotein Pal n=1 Tax=Arenimonas sp. TaxID=1872635 RepID=UPI0039E29D27